VAGEHEPMGISYSKREPQQHPSREGGKGGKIRGLRLPLWPSTPACRKTLVGRRLRCRKGIQKSFIKKIELASRRKGEDR